VTRKVFFSFHYDDVWKVMQIRNCWTVVGDRETAGFIDKAEFEKVERQGHGAIERWIDQQLDGTSATIVLIGQKTAERPYVQYEIKRSYERGNRLLGIYLDNIKNESGSTDFFRGSNPFDQVQVAGGVLGTTPVSSKLQVPLYDWVLADGRKNISSWIETAPRKEP
jgi:hypothetical protein